LTYNDGSLQNPPAPLELLPEVLVPVLPAEEPVLLPLADPEPDPDPPIGPGILDGFEVLHAANADAAPIVIAQIAGASLLR
jgi:hypothetical protein